MFYIKVFKRYSIFPYKDKNIAFKYKGLRDADSIQELWKIKTVIIENLGNFKGQNMALLW
jgi:hypothetical protein